MGTPLCGSAMAGVGKFGGIGAAGNRGGAKTGDRRDSGMARVEVAEAEGGLGGNLEAML